jgi:hypothetical protein
LHDCGAVGLGALSLYFDDDGIFNENISIFWSMGYFLVDIVDCASRLDAAFTLHAAFCLVLGLANYRTPIMRQMRLNSKATMCELSSPVLSLSKRTRKPWHFALFAAVFTLCRVAWLPIIVIQLHRAGMSATDPRFLCVLAFYGLNLFWYYKILRILARGTDSEGDGGGKDQGRDRAKRD